MGNIGGERGRGGMDKKGQFRDGGKIEANGVGRFRGFSEKENERNTVKSEKKRKEEECITSRHGDEHWGEKSIPGVAF